MKAAILCGGRGTRLREVSETLPKPMVPIGDRPIIWHIMKIYAAHGVTEFVLLLGYKGDIIRDFFLNYAALAADVTVDLNRSGEDRLTFHKNVTEDWKVTLVNTGLTALKGARMRRLARFIPEDDELFMMTYGDGVCSLDLGKHLDFHKSHGKMVTVTGVIPSMRFGEIRSRDDGSVIFREKERNQAAMVNGGYYVLHRSVLDMLEDDDAQDFEYGPLEELSDRGEVRMRRHEGFWHCMDHLRDMEALDTMWAEGNAPWKLW